MFASFAGEDVTLLSVGVTMLCDSDDVTPVVCVTTGRGAEVGKVVRESGSTGRNTSCSSSEMSEKDSSSPSLDSLTETHK